MKLHMESILGWMKELSQGIYLDHLKDLKMISLIKVCLDWLVSNDSRFMVTRVN